MSHESVPVPLSDAVDRFVNRVGLTMAWAYVLLVLVIILQVVLRKGFANGLIVLEELQWHLYAVGVMFGLASVQANNAHVRVDLFYSRFSQRKKRWVEVLGILFLLLPFLLIVFLNSLDFVWESWRINERSPATSGLPLRWLIKGVIPAAMGLLIMAALSRLFRELYLLKKEGE